MTARVRGTDQGEEVGVAILQAGAVGRMAGVRHSSVDIFPAGMTTTLGGTTGVCVSGRVTRTTRLRRRRTADTATAVATRRFARNGFGRTRTAAAAATATAATTTTAAAAADDERQLRVRT